MPHFDAEWRIEGIQINDRLNEIRGSLYSHRSPVMGWEAVETGQKQGPCDPPEQGWGPFDIGSVWGGKDVTVWFRATASVPEEMEGKRVVALIRPGGESLVYINGEPCQGLDRNRDEVLLLERARGGEIFEILIESYSSARFDEKHTFQYADLAAVNTDVHKFYWDARVAFDVLQILPRGSATQLRMMELLNRCVKTVDLGHRGDERYEASIEKAQTMLDQGMKGFQVGEGFDPSRTGLGSLCLTGHSHIDTAWLWPLRETQRKCGRTFASVLKYMEEYPYYNYSQSQPQLYEYTKKYYPTVYEGIRKRVKEGRWEPVGATWVEQDSNISSGESLVRQLLYGNRFFRKEFGIHSRTCWLPDAFGFCWSLPQILKKAGVDFFATTKIDWSQYNKFPYSLFLWQGIDGTRILSIMPPLNYNGSLAPRDCLAQWEQFKQKDQCDELVYSFGHGDGGGGPTKEMLETGIRLEDMVGVPKCSFGRVQDYFDRLDESVDEEKLPVWNGELYLELHRACQTTQSRTKRNNRKSELLYRDAEFLASMAMLRGGYYPQGKLYEGWKVILCSQFHDILPGSSINEVYEDTDKSYAEVLKAGREVVSGALESLKQKIDTSGSGRAIIVFNTLSWSRDDVASAKVKLAGEDFAILDEEGRQVLCQIIGSDGEYTEILFEANNVPPMGYVVYRLVAGEKMTGQPGNLAVLSQNMENSLYRIELDEKGTVSRIYDKSMDKEVIAENCRGNVLQFFDDRPHAHDAWDVDFNFTENMQELARLESVEVTETGPVRATVRVVRRTEKSSIVQDISIYSKLPRIDFVTNVDWWEKRTLMKVTFPVEILSPRATYEIQFGTMERPTHFNTSWDRAKFEVPAQRWVDLSEGDYGVSLMNDCKYGHDVHDNVIRLSLLRSPISPDPHADEGKHQFTYSLHPHMGDWREGETVQRAYELNCPLIGVPVEARLESGSESQAGELPSWFSFASLDKRHVVIDAIKKAEDSDEIIVRVYEAYGQRGKVTLTFGIAPEKVAECNLMEEVAAHAGVSALDVSGKSVSFYVKPYEIRTFKVKFG
jgi:alpha-mannosidase